MSLNKLYFDAILVDEKAGSVEVSPHFLCPKCSDQSNPTTRPASSVSSGKSVVSPAEDLNMNQLVVFTMPCCGAKVSLYVAMHETNGKSDLMTCISSEPIAADWWRRA